MNYYSPIFDFWFTQQNFKITRYLSIESDEYKLTELDNTHYLSKSDIRDISMCKFWVKINEKKPKDLKPSVILNMLILAFRILSPTKVQIKYRFGENGHFSRMLDRFQFNRVDDNKLEYGETDIENISNYYKSFVKIARKNRRLNTALYSTFLGSISYSWQAAFILYSAAFESILTYSKDMGITNRLSKSYACIVEKTKRKRDYYYRRFKKLYQVRSDIMHGRIYSYRRNTTNLRQLSDTFFLLSKLWKIILNDQSIINVLEEDDHIRKNFFNHVEKGYNMPIKNSL